MEQHKSQNSMSKLPIQQKLTLFIFLSCVFAVSLTKSYDLDTLTHLNMGKLFVETSGVPSKEVFCYTAENAPLSFSWLFSVACYLLWLITGWYGLSFVVALLMVVLAYTSFVEAKFQGYSNDLITTLLLFSAILFMSLMDRISLRAELLEYVFFILSIHVSAEYVFNGNKKIFALPFILLAWANIHSSIPLAFLIYAAFNVYLFGLLFFPKLRIADNQFDVSKLKNKLIFFNAIFAFSLLLTLLNPNGIFQYLYGLDVLKTQWYKNNILELRTPSAKQIYFSSAIFIVTFLTSLKSLKSKSIPYLLVNIALFYLSTISIRFLTSYVILIAPITAKSISLIFKKSLQKINKLGLPIVILPLITVLFITKMPPFEEVYYSYKEPGVGANLEVDHQGAVMYLSSKNITGRVFNKFSGGQSIIWEGWPDFTVYVDGRGAIPENYLQMGSEFMNPKILDQLQREFGFEILIFNRELPEEFSPGKITEIFRNDAWALVYFDEKSYVLLRREGPYQNIVNNEAYSHIKTFRDFNQYTEQVNKDPVYRKGLIQEIERAMANKRKSDPDYLLLGMCYYFNGQYTKAIEYTSKVEKLKHFSDLYIGKTLIAQGDLNRGINYLTEGFEKYKAANYILTAAEAYAKNGHYLKAVSLIEDNLNKPFNSYIYAKLANYYFSAGQINKARENARKSAENNN